MARSAEDMDKALAALELWAAGMSRWFRQGWPDTTKDSKPYQWWKDHDDRIGALEHKAQVVSENVPPPPPPPQYPPKDNPPRHK